MKNLQVFLLGKVNLTPRLRGHFSFLSTHLKMKMIYASNNKLEITVRLIKNKNRFLLFVIN